MRDAGHEMAEEALKLLEREYARIYSKAVREMREKQRKALKNFDAERSMRLKALDDSDEVALNAYKAWLASEVAGQAWMAEMVDMLSASALAANVKAADALNDMLPAVFAENANWAAFTIDKAAKVDTAFTLVDDDTVRGLVAGRVGRAATHGELVQEVTIPAEVRRRSAMIGRPLPDTRKDMRWNRQKFKSAITQGILQGESIPKIVKRTEGIFGGNMAAAIRAARTATTCAENAGRISSYERAEEMGIEMVQEWVATMDDRTRESHRILDGVQVGVGESWETENGPIAYPGDPAADPADTWNCRCSVRGRVKGFDGEKPDRWDNLPSGITYEEWKAGKNADGEALTYSELMDRRRNA